MGDHDDGATLRHCVESVLHFRFIVGGLRRQWPRPESARFSEWRVRCHLLLVTGQVLRLGKSSFFYFPKPQAPWKRGTNENTNGLIHKYCPKSLEFVRYFVF